MTIGITIPDLLALTYMTISAPDSIDADVSQNDALFLAEVNVPTGPDDVLVLQVHSRDDAKDLVTSLRHVADEIEAAL